VSHEPVLRNIIGNTLLGCGENVPGNVFYHLMQRIEKIKSIEHVTSLIV
jgi:hypothetical protein